jgi:acetylornithine/succinyldiaminopimelate/putrescine aminotransferase
MEPVPINLGVLMPPRSFMSGLQKLCRRHGTLLVMDEVASGFGRTGRLFACEHFGLEPDILCLGKALTGGYAAMGATLMTPAVARSMQEKGSFYSTFGWHPLSVAAALANLRYLVRHRIRLLRNVAAVSAEFRRRLAEIRFGSPATIRIQGLDIALEFHDHSYASVLQKRCLKRHLLVASKGESMVMLLPPLNIGRKDAARGLDLLAACA